MAQNDSDQLFWIDGGEVKQKRHTKGRVYDLGLANQEKSARKITTPLYLIEQLGGEGYWWCWDGTQSSRFKPIDESKVPPRILLYRLLEVPDGIT